MFPLNSFVHVLLRVVCSFSYVHLLVSYTAIPFTDYDLSNTSFSRAVSDRRRLAIPYCPKSSERGR